MANIVNWICKVVAITFWVSVMAVTAFMIFFIWACLAVMGGGYM